MSSSGEDNEGPGDMEDDDYEYDGYYNSQTEDDDLDHRDTGKNSKTDAENFQFKCLRVEEAERLLKEVVETLSTKLNITPSKSRLLLHAFKWSTEDLMKEYEKDPYGTLITARVQPADNINSNDNNNLPNPNQNHPPNQYLTILGTSSSSNEIQCPVCYKNHPQDSLKGLACSHNFCKDCWSSYFEIQISEGKSTEISCMAQDCFVISPEDFTISILQRQNVKEKYQRFALRDYIKSHPQLKFCPGRNCDIIVHVVSTSNSTKGEDPHAKRVLCSECKTDFCFDCTNDFHAPTDCLTIKRWLTKCSDDSESSNYISAHTKDCPNSKCGVRMEKMGGCNHMQCSKCSHNFCWMCMRDWKSHERDYYECSKYKENPPNPNLVKEEAKEALKKYLHYYGRWENHSKSLKLEEQTLQRMKKRIEAKVMDKDSDGTWIDWQYLFDGADLLKKCRYTLKYTYPYAYYLENGSRKELFEYQQAQLEAEIENLSWKIERAENTHRGDLQNQMDIAEKRRSVLLKEF